ncbi:MAG TPA: PSD1 and planctomycete cytochrome C domain-containing protein [Pirellulaceae bacterium]|nr:PSD1 and planctomycete cytochrome C domain-containing protein [Pirellulaceae bacterium]
MTRHACLSVFALCLGGIFCAAAAGADEASVAYEKQVRPILKAHCFQCHGEDQKHEGNLDLRMAKLIQQGGDSGPAIVAGKSADSLLIQRVSAGEMPPEGKKLSEKEVATLRAWVDQGAKTARPEPESLADVTDEERSFWSFQPIASPPVPDASGSSVHSLIDNFLLVALKAKGLAFSPEADRTTLIRRLYYDLVGLPPAPEDVDEFLADARPDAYERVVDRLLSQSQYGERWGRHWLDVAGYADSDGYTERDPERKYAYKYRDYVIRALNADKPWDVFIREQLAGDELLAPLHTNLSPDKADLLAATGFLRMVPDGTGDGGVDQNVARNDVIAETIKVVSSSLLGLTVGCAQCHNHRYDPIPQTDYYRLRAVFEPAYDTKNWRPPQARLVSLWSDDVRQQAAAIDAELKALADERLAALDKIVAEIFDSEVAKLPEERRELARKARETPQKERTPDQEQILKDFPSLKVDRGSAYLYDGKRVGEHNKSFDARQKEMQARRPADDYVPCLTEVPGQIPETFLFSRGDVNQPKQQVEPADLHVLSRETAQIPVDDPSLPTSGRRLAYARWLTGGQHPLVPRVLVNRFWMHHFGRGLVATPSDFGVLGARPTHLELLDWLATRFMSDGWELKRLHRLLVNSTAYRQSSRRTEALERADRDNLLLGRMSIRRLEAEAVRDSLLAASGRIELELYGSPVAVTVDEVGQVIVGLDNRDSAGRPEGKRGSLGSDEFRRSVYVQVRRSQRLSMLETFDAPTLNPNCELRSRSTVAPQSLLLMNSDFVLAQSQALAERAVALGGDDPAARVKAAWRLALVQPPTDAQVQAAVAFVAAQQQELAAQPTPDPKKPFPPAETRALAALCQALYSSNAFLYVD